MGSRASDRITGIMALGMLLSACGGGAGGESPGGFCNSSQSQKCPAGQYCINGLCETGCLSNQDCAGDQYCDLEGFFSEGVCANRSVPACTTDSQCAEGLRCVNGMCALVEQKACTPRPDGMDGCDAASLCLDEDDQGPKTPACYAFPACPESGTCPVGTFGALCNDGIIPGKARICLTGLCQVKSHCPAGFFCVLLLGTLGQCSTGGLGSFCNQEAECLEGLVCEGALPGFPGMCVEE